MKTSHLLATLCAGLLLVAPVSAVQLSTAEREACAAEGGCHVITQDKMDALVESVFKAGFERGSISCGNRS